VGAVSAGSLGLAVALLMARARDGFSPWRKSWRGILFQGESFTFIDDGLDVTKQRSSYLGGGS
jgi:hypothetical protein